MCWCAVEGERKGGEDGRAQKERKGQEESEKRTFKSPIQTNVSQSHTPYPSCVPPSGLGASGLKFGVHRSLSLPFSSGKSSIDAVSRAWALRWVTFWVKAARWEFRKVKGVSRYLF
jgi:hypothetical protein